MFSRYSALVALLCGSLVSADLFIGIEKAPEVNVSFFNEAPLSGSFSGILSQVATGHEAFLVHADSQEAKLQAQNTLFAESTLISEVRILDDKTFYFVTSEPGVWIDQGLHLCELEALHAPPKFTEEVPLYDPSVMDISGSDKEALLNNINIDFYWETLRKLAGDLPMQVGGVNKTLSTRYALSSDIQHAENFIAQFFTSLGFDEVKTQDFPLRSGVATNVIGVKLGTTKPDEVIVIGAHYDSTSQKETTLAPGAVDNGSGAAGVVALAKAFATFEFPRTIHFITFSGEEQGLYGSQYYVDQAKKNGVKVAGSLVMDMIGYSNKYYGVKMEGTNDSKIRELLKSATSNVKSFAPKLSHSEAYYSYGSDHVPFQRAGIPCILFIEMDETEYAHYHKTTDTVSQNNKDQCHDILRGVAATAYDLVNSHPFVDIIDLSHRL